MSENKDIRISPSAIHGEKVIGVSLEKYNELEEQHATNLVERNSFLVEKERLEKKVNELETELYFCNRNKRIGEVVDERT